MTIQSVLGAVKNKWILFLFVKLVKQKNKWILFLVLSSSSISLRSDLRAEPGEEAAAGGTERPRGDRV